ncbi:MAG: SUMF1/EgtB/PvdO family nonheme iron enzyme, partial [Planctomycetota bacterium]
YAEWRGKRLPTLAELIYAGSGPTIRRFPWDEEDSPGTYRGNFEGRPIGPDDLKDMLAFAMENSVPSRSMPEAATPEGVFHLLGNVSEITGSLFVDSFGGESERTWPYLRFATGGTWSCATYRHTILNSATKATYHTPRDMSRTGFRCARSAEPPE